MSLSAVQPFTSSSSIDRPGIVCWVVEIFALTMLLLLPYIFYIGLVVDAFVCTRPFFMPTDDNTNRRLRITAPLHLKRGGTKKKKDKGNTITVNKLAFRNYEVIEKWEAGISLLGTEVKSIRDGKMNIRDGFVKPNKNGRSCTLLGVHIGKHATAGEFFQHEERRPRDLLLNKNESRKLLQQTDRMPGMTIVPLKAYWNEQNKVKFEIGLCRGKNVRDKREDIKEREGKREENRMIKNFNS